MHDLLKIFNNLRSNLFKDNKKINNKMCSCIYDFLLKKKINNNINLDFYFRLMVLN